MNIDAKAPAQESRAVRREARMKTGLEFIHEGSPIIAWDKAYVLIKRRGCAGCGARNSARWAVREFMHITLMRPPSEHLGSRSIQISVPVVLCESCMTPGMPGIPCPDCKAPLIHCYSGYAPIDICLSCTPEAPFKAWCVSTDAEIIGKAYLRDVVADSPGPLTEARTASKVDDNAEKAATMVHEELSQSRMAMN